MPTQDKVVVIVKTGQIYKRGELNFVLRIFEKFSQNLFLIDMRPNTQPKYF